MVVTTLLGYFLLLTFFYLEGHLRRGAQARSLEAGQFDQHATRFLVYAYFVSALALLAAWPLNIMHLGRLPWWAGWPGDLLALCGLLMRVWSHHLLGEFYTRTLMVVKGQSIFREGPYRIIRHPGYLGMIMMWIGVAEATGNWIIMLAVAAVIIAAYHYRILTEERMLMSTLPGYAEYRLGTWRLIPLIY